MRLHRRLQPFLCETGLCVFLLRTAFTPETGRRILILWINCCWILCQIIAKSNCFFWVFSKEPIQESKWVPRLVSCVSATQSMPQNPAILTCSDSDTLQRFIFCKLRCERKAWYKCCVEAFVPTGTPYLSPSSFDSFVWSCIGWKSLWPPAVDAGSSSPKGRFSQGCEPFVQPVSTSLSQTQTISNIFCHGWPDVWWMLKAVNYHCLLSKIFSLKSKNICVYLVCFWSGLWMRWSINTAINIRPNFSPAAKTMGSLKSIRSFWTRPPFQHVLSWQTLVLLCKSSSVWSMRLVWPFSQRRWKERTCWNKSLFVLFTAPFTPPHLSHTTCLV